MTGREEKEETSFKIVFNGEDEGWQDYHDKFKAFGEYKKWWTALEADATGDETEEKKTTRKKARYALIMSTQGDAAEYVRAEPDPYYGWLSLMERYDKKDGNDLKSLYKKWDDLISEGPGSKDPKLWFLKLAEKEADIVQAGGKAKDPTEVVALVENTMSGMKHYESIVELIGMQEKRNELFFWKLQLFEHWKRKIKGSFDQKNEDDVAFVAEGTSKKWPKKTGYKPFKGVCNNCGKIGHKAFQCKAPESTRGLGENRKCFKCHQRGHIAKDCHNRNSHTNRNSFQRGAENRAPEAMFVGVVGEGDFACKPCTRKTTDHEENTRKKSWFDICEEDNDDLDNNDDVGSWEDIVMTFEERTKVKEEPTYLWDEMVIPAIKVKLEDNVGSYDSDDDFWSNKSDDEDEMSIFDYRSDDAESVHVTMMDGRMNDTSDEESKSEKEDAPTLDDDNSSGKIRCEDCNYFSTTGPVCERCMECRAEVRKEIENRAWYYAKNYPPKHKVFYRPAERIELMRTQGIGLCAECVALGPKGEICVSCFTEQNDEKQEIFYYMTPEAVLPDGMGICYSCDTPGSKVFGPVGNVYITCTHGIYVAIPLRPTTGSFEIVDTPSDKIQDDNSRDYVVMSVGGNPNYSNSRETRMFSNLWLLDSGATLHVTNDESYLKDPMEVNKLTTVGNGESVIATKQGWVEIHLGGDKRMRLQEVVFVPSFMKNIISVNKLCKNGAMVLWQETKAVLRALNGQKVMVPKRRNGMFYLSDRGRSQQPRDEIFETNEIMQKRVKPYTMDINVAHALLGHPSEEITRATMAYYNVRLMGDMQVCAACATEKGRKKNVTKTPAAKAEQPCQRLLLDTTGPYSPSLRGSIYDVYVVCQATNKRWIFNCRSFGVGQRARV